MDRVLSTLGFGLFAVVSFAHFRGLCRVVAMLWPNFDTVATLCLMAIWVAALGMLVQALFHNRLKPAFAVVFFYAMLVMLAGMRVLDGVPSKAADANWRDPNGLLTPDAEYVLHNHGAVSRIISREEFELYSLYGTCYFTAGGMLMTTALCLLPVDRDNQLGSRKPMRIRVSTGSW
jgi:hypothetical protein